MGMNPVLVVVVLGLNVCPSKTTRKQHGSHVLLLIKNDAYFNLQSTKVLIDAH